MCLHLNEWSCLLPERSPSSISDHVSISLLFLSIPTASVPQKLHPPTSPINHTVFYMQAPDGTESLWQTVPDNPLRRWQRRDPGWAPRLPCSAWPALALAEGSPTDLCRLLPFKKLPECHILKSTKRKRTFRNGSIGCSAACGAAREKKQRGLTTIHPHVGSTGLVATLNSLEADTLFLWSFPFSVPPTPNFPI